MKIERERDIFFPLRWELLDPAWELTRSPGEWLVETQESGRESRQASRLTAQRGHLGSSSEARKSALAPPPRRRIKLAESTGRLRLRSTALRMVAKSWLPISRASGREARPPLPDLSQVRLRVSHSFLENSVPVLSWSYCPMQDNAPRCCPHVAAEQLFPASGTNEVAEAWEPRVLQVNYGNPYRRGWPQTWARKGEMGEKTVKKLGVEPIVRIKWKPAL